ncbi:MAG TPA: hypothetical protein PKW11_05620, partial [Pseudomonadota bacterium]|nr:hypothetical protein [Pseudomonadota bacterium]
MIGTPTQKRLRCGRGTLAGLFFGLCQLLLTASAHAQAPAEAPHPVASYPVFDLLANRTLAHIEQRGGLVIPAGSAGFARYAHFGRPTPTWKLRAEVDGKKVALPTTAAKLQVP